MKLVLGLSAFGFVLCSLANPFKINIDLDIASEEQQVKPVIVKDEYHSESSSGRWPVVRLPAERHQGYPSADGFSWKFENIPFAQPPLSTLRFAAAKPLTPITDDLKLPFNEGNSFKICPQMQAGWVPLAAKFLPDYFAGSLGTKWDTILDSSAYEDITKVVPPPNQSEDCLTLDVHVPKRVFKNETAKAPVMVWIFGGGFIFGSKTQFGPPDGLFRAASSHIVSDDSDDSSQDFIFVSINYRLGAFGWLGGNDFEDARGFENAGLSDQLVALEWVRDNIHKFGGDPLQVTVIGESAGAASIMHHIVSNKKLPFKRAILQSPGFFPSTSQAHFNKMFTNFRSEVGVDTLAKLRSADSADLIAANANLVYKANFGTFPFGPIVDGEYIKEPPATLLRGGNYHKDIEVMVAHNAAEGALFTPPWIRTKAHLRDLIESYFGTSITEANMTKILDDLYPVPEGRYTPAYTKEKVAMDAMGDVGVECNDYFMAKAFPNAYRYFFNMYPGLHGQDAAYTFYPISQHTPTAAQDTNALRLQRYITSFVKTGNPNGPNTNDKVWGRWNETGKVYTINALGDGLVSDELQKKDRMEKCEFWAGAPYYHPEDAALSRSEKSGKGEGLRTQGSATGEGFEVEVELK